MDENELDSCSGVSFEIDRFVTIVQQSISLVGLLLNSILIFVTFRHKSLHHACGFLMAICALCDALMESTSFLPTILVLFCKKIRMLTCFWAQLHGNFSYSFLCLFFTAVDRLLAAAFPIFYCFNFANHFIKYVLFIQLFCFSLSILVIKKIYENINSEENKNILVFCQPAEILRGDAQQFALYIIISFTLATVGIYLAIWVLLRTYYSSNPVAQEQLAITQKIFKSLASLIAIIFCCMFCTAFGIYLTVNFIKDISYQMLISKLLGQLICVANAVNLPVLYFSSSEYRQAVQCELKRFFHLFKSSTQVIQLQQNSSFQPRV